RALRNAYIFIKKSTILMTTSRPALQARTRRPKASRVPSVRPRQIGVRRVVWMMLTILWPAAEAPAQTGAQLSQQSEACVACHEATSPGIVGQWKGSGHDKSHVG